MFFLRDFSALNLGAKRGVTTSPSAESWPAVVPSVAEGGRPPIKHATHPLSCGKNNNMINETDCNLCYLLLCYSC